MKKLRQWIADRRDRRLRIKLVMKLKRYPEWLEAYRFIIGD